jgi:hypothetical protein
VYLLLEVVLYMVDVLFVYQEVGFFHRNLNLDEYKFNLCVMRSGKCCNDIHETIVALISFYSFVSAETINNNFIYKYKSYLIAHYNSLQ